MATVKPKKKVGFPDMMRTASSGAASGGAVAPTVTFKEEATSGAVAPSLPAPAAPATAGAGEATSARRATSAVAAAAVPAGSLAKQDLATLDVKTLTPLTHEIISRQATINIGTIGHVAHGKSTVVRAISGVKTPRFKSELVRNITIKLGYANAKIYRTETAPYAYESHGSFWPDEYIMDDGSGYVFCARLSASDACVLFLATCGVCVCTTHARYASSHQRCPSHF